MSDLDEIFLQDINFAIEQAKKDHRFELSEYINLRESNDAIRTESVKWLFDTVLDIVFAFNRHDAGIKLTQKENHHFPYGNANLRGQLLTLRKGVRCLEIEAGWTKTPSDGFMRGGALAFARIKHFGFNKLNEDLALLKYNGKPEWFIVADELNRISFNVRSLRKHFETFLGEN